MRPSLALAVAIVTVASSPRQARADDEPAEPAPGPSAIAPAPALAPRPEAVPSKLQVDALGYVEAYFAYNLGRPANAVTAYRGFDNRHSTFSISNAALGAAWSYERVSGRLILQMGPTGASYYASEPVRAAEGAANATGPELWRYLQEANVSWKAPTQRELVVTAGLVPSPIGYEAFAVKDNWAWSRSNLFFGLPFYHAGVRVEYAVTGTVTMTWAVYNGWNSVVDNNEEKSVQTSVVWKPSRSFDLKGLYFGGIERRTGSEEGPYWRHHFDAVAGWRPADWLTAAAQLDYGFEPNRIGTARWAAAAVSARARVLSWAFVSWRGDRFHEHLATHRDGRSSAPLFWGGSEWVTSGTTTLDIRPHDHVSVRLEHRLDVAEAPLYFRRAASSHSQETVLLGVTSWF